MFAFGVLDGEQHGLEAKLPLGFVVCCGSWVFDFGLKCKFWVFEAEF